MIRWFQIILLKNQKISTLFCEIFRRVQIQILFDLCYKGKFIREKNVLLPLIKFKKFNQLYHEFCHFFLLVVFNLIL